MLKRRFPLTALLMTALLITVIMMNTTGTTIRAEEKQDASGVELTVYNQNLALVKDRRTLDIPAGIANLNFSEVSSQIDPTSVQLRSLSLPALKVLEQNYEYDIVSSEKLLQKYLGQKVTLVTTKGETVEGYLLSAEGTLIIASEPTGGQVKIITSGTIQSISFPELPGGLIIRPTLAWLLQNPGKAGPQQLELTYLTGGLSWKADYVATVNADDNKVDLIGWVTLDNQSGADYKDARLKLIAGDVNRVEDERNVRAALLEAKMDKAPEASGFQEQSFFEYHLYTLGRSTTIKNNQTKQVELLTANSVPAQKLFIYDGARNGKKVNVVMEMKNSKESNLGIALPKGRIRVQKADGEGSLQFIGEDTIDHTPKDETLRLMLGNAFDITGERTQTNVNQPKDRTREETYQIKLRNHKKEKVTVTIVEHMSNWNEWNIIKNDAKFRKKDVQTVEFTVTIPADGEATVNYTVRYKW
ncbi:MAG TPA: DUF4139 domain-containing protein [Bacillota bacterium]|nr:DUF4139 domain-containing protein [Bacillota bacterium]